MRLRTVLSLLLVGALAFAACGSSDESSSSDPSEIIDSDGDLDDFDTLPDNFDGSSECLEFSAAFADLATASGTAFGMSEDDVKKFKDDLSKINASVPGEIKDDWKVFSAAYVDLVDVVGSGDFTSPDAQAAMQALDRPEVEEATENITAWLGQNCDMAGRN